jgi:hypothetical protein
MRRIAFSTVPSGEVEGRGFGAGFSATPLAASQ